MRLSAKLLKNVVNVNAWEYASNATIRENQTNTFYIQLIDMDRPIQADLLNSPALRFIPIGTVISMSAFFDSLEDDSQFTVNGTMPFSEDASIWKFELSASQLPSSGHLRLSLTVDGSSQTFYIKQAIVTELLEIGPC